MGLALTSELAFTEGRRLDAGRSLTVSDSVKNQCVVMSVIENGACNLDATCTSNYVSIGYCLLGGAAKSGGAVGCDVVTTGVPTWKGVSYACNSMTAAATAGKYNVDQSVDYSVTYADAAARDSSLLAVQAVLDSDELKTSLTTTVQSVKEATFEYAKDNNLSLSSFVDTTTGEISDASLKALLAGSDAGTALTSSLVTLAADGDSLTTAATSVNAAVASGVNFTVTVTGVTATADGSVTSGAAAIISPLIVAFIAVLGMA